MNRRALVIGLFALAVLTWLRITLVNHLPDQGFFEKYLVLARSLPRERLAEVSPAYLWLMVLLRGLGPHAIRTIQIIVVSIAALFVADAGNRLAGPVAAIAAAFFLLTSRATLVCATDLEPETLIVLFDAIALAALTRERWLVAGAALGVSTTARPVALIAAFAIGAWLLITRRDLRATARFAIAIAMPILAAVTINFFLTGEALLMDPGCAFYEGMNASDAGYAGVQPRIVKEIEAASTAPDYVHVAYRVVASRAAGHTVSHRESNAWWTAKGIAFVRHYPAVAARWTLRKLLFALESYDRWDLVTMYRKSRALERLPIWIPFGVLIALSGVALLRRRTAAVMPLLFAAASGVVLVVFFVSARQREALIPALCTAAAIGVAELGAMWSRNRGEAAVLVAAVLAIALLLGVEGPAQREDRYGWDFVGDEQQRAFDQAMALEQAGEWVRADALLEQLQNDGYQPLRESMAVSSVAFYRARAAVHLNRDPRPQLAIAAREAPGDVHVLTMNFVLGDRSALATAYAIHDPFTVERALATSWAERGNMAAARELMEDLQRRIPEWH